MKYKLILIVLFSGVLFLINYQVRKYNHDFKRAKEAYLNVFKNSNAGKIAYTENFNNQLIRYTKNPSADKFVKALFIFFDTHGSVISNMESQGDLISVERKINNPQNVITFYFKPQHGGWALDSLTNILAVIQKMECASQNDLIIK